ncbi:MAG: hypothetical protein OEY62_09715 [Acidimicrobiia bacterium]|nr:hypothetical protein [Acidimicrobiia bacterium]
MAWHTVRRSVFVGPPLVLVFWLARGGSGAWASALAVVLIGLNFLASGWLLSVSTRISLAFYHAAALFGFVLRLGLLTLTVLVVARYTDLDRLAFGISAVVAYLVLITWEAVMVSRGAERELEWTA